jgi:hypothetical protein
VRLAFLLKFSTLQRFQTETFFGKIFCDKNKKMLAAWQLLKFCLTAPVLWCTGDDADKFLLRCL